MQRLGFPIFCTLLFAILLISGTANAEPASRDTVTRYYSISPTAFVPEHHSLMWLKMHGHLQSSSTNATFLAPVYLPDSARVIEFKAWVRDSFPTNNITVKLIRGQIHAQYVAPMAMASSVAGAGNQELTDDVIELSPIDNSAYTYSAEVHLWAPDFRHALYGMRIKYEVIQGGTAVDETSETVGSMPIKEIFPIPFSYETVIRYEVPKTNMVFIKIFDEQGDWYEALLITQCLRGPILRDGMGETLKVERLQLVPISVL